MDDPDWLKEHDLVGLRALAVNGGLPMHRRARGALARIERHALVGGDRPLVRGEAWLVGVGAGVRGGAQRGELWLLRADAFEGDVPLVRAAMESARLAEWLAFRDLPHRSAELAAPRAHWSVAPIVATSRELDGASYGLALFLAVASRAMDLVPHPTLVALGCIDAHGRVGPVDGLDAKLETLARWAPRLETLIVSREDLSLVQGKLQASVKVIGVADTGGALDAAWNGLERSIREGWAPNRARRSREVRRLYRQALRSESALGWRGVLRAVDALAGGTDASHTTEDGRRLKLTRQIAQRHCDNSGTIPWPSEAALDELNRPDRLLLLAHVVQSEADAGAANARTLLDRAERHLNPPRDRHTEDLRLLGAMGRLAAHVDLPRATQYLDQAIMGWTELDAYEEMSRPLCEGIRLHGLTGNAERVDELRALAAELSHMPDESTRGFVRWAVGVALVLLRRAEDAQAVLEVAEAPRDLERVPPFVEAGRRRWLARAARLRGDRHRAAEIAEGIESVFASTGLFARLDHAIDVSADPSEILHRIRKDPVARNIVARLEQHPQRREPVAVWLADAYPY
ncbi:MAG: hypothetical protein KF901_32135 [Myxococcales bacterium]|nr:hypothetical protein [Myxococcales bacterium]